VKGSILSKQPEGFFLRAIGVMHFLPTTYEYYTVAVYLRLRTCEDQVKIVYSFLRILNLFIDVFIYNNAYYLYIAIYYGEMPRTFWPGQAIINLRR
jgi:hypothetical protein